MIKFAPFKIDSLFTKQDLGIKKKDFDKKKDVSKVRTSEFNLPLTNAKFGDNGIMFYGREEDFDSAEMCIDIVQNGVIATGKVYAQPQKTGVLWDSYLIKSNYKRINAEILLYLTKSLEKSIQEKFNYDKKATWDRVRQEYIVLPTSDGKNPNYKYMAKRIRALEKEHIRALEEERVRALENYLTASGLNSYELTEEEVNLQNTPLKFRKFTVDDLFIVLKGRRKLSKLNFSMTGTVPVYTAETTNNGILGYTNEAPDYKIGDGITQYLIFGDHTKTMNIAKTDFSVADNVKVLIPKINNDNAILYICTVWKKAIPNIGYARYWRLAKNCVISLPVDDEGKLDIDFMDQYMKLLQKKAIKEAIDNKDMIIDKTKKVVGVLS